MTANGSRARSRTRPVAGAMPFVLKFMVYWIVALAVVSQQPSVERWAVDSTVATISRVLRLVSVQSSVSGNRVSLGATGVEIVPDCTPLTPILVLWAAMCAFPMPWRRRIPGLLLAAVAVWAFNLLRVLTLIAVLLWKPAVFHVAHVYLWQTGTLLAVAATFMLWVRSQTRPEVAR